MIRLITIDLDDTLWPCLPPLLRAEQACFAWLRGVAAPITQVYDLGGLQAHRLRLRDLRPELAHDITALRHESLRLLLREFGYAESLAAEGMALFLAERHRVNPYPDVTTVLRAWRDRYWLGALTNGNADVFRTELGGHFHFALTAAEVGASKPAPNLFLAALDRAGVEAAEALHLGDDPELDITPAAGLGFRTAWMNRDHQAWPPGLPPPDIQVLDLNQLEDWLTCASSC